MMDLTIREIVEACGGKLVLADERESGWLCPGTELSARMLVQKRKELSCEAWQEMENVLDFKVGSVVIDSRKAEPGSVFVATVGERVDGHKFVASVLAQGAALAIVEKTPVQVGLEQGCEAPVWGNYLIVENTLQALKDLGEFYRRKLPVKVVGITGSVGKTSTKEFVAGVLAEKYCVLKTEGNFNNEIGVPLTLLRLRPEHEVAVVEMGISEFREMHRLSKMARPDICVITNIGQCHLENLKTRDGILLAKTEIFDFMAENGEICLNGEDDKLIEIAEVKGHKPHFFGFGGNQCQEVVATDIKSNGLFGSEATLVLKSGKMLCSGACDAAEVVDACNAEIKMEVQVPLPGRHMVLNAAAATCVARLLGLEEFQIAEGISKIAPVSGRNNLICLQRYTLIDDCYNANPASMKAAIDLLNMADTKKIAILGDMFELGEDSDKLHSEVGVYAAQAGIDTIYCVGANSRFMYEAALKEIATVDAEDVSCMERTKADCGDSMANVQRVEYFASREALLDALKTGAAELLPEGTTVLLKASHGMHFAEVLEYIQCL